jgi:hypothetical protein
MYMNINKQVTKLGFIVENIVGFQPRAGIHNMILTGTDLSLVHYLSCYIVTSQFLKLVCMLRMVFVVILIITRVLAELSNKSVCFYIVTEKCYHVKVPAILWKFYRNEKQYNVLYSDKIYGYISMISPEQYRKGFGSAVQGY